MKNARAQNISINARDHGSTDPKASGLNARTKRKRPEAALVLSSVAMAGREHFVEGHYSCSLSSSSSAV